ncbi:MAG: MogA/MoaB family molybdenum cofactor biosynthesis protein [Acidimicrobiia bacterium]|nr:MogA/MoaB family molybdenum cofactor biosynthesis protein [Acidimicrobiia bacterium]
MNAGPLRAAVVVCSDGVAAGVREDRSGAVARELLVALGFEVDLVDIVADDRDAIETTLARHVSHGVNLVVTSGGTGFGTRDVTPEATLAIVEREAPGLAEAVRAASPVPFGMLSRGVAGTAGTTVVVNLPGSTGGVRDGLDALAPALVHACELAAGVDSGHPHASG